MFRNTQQVVRKIIYFHHRKRSFKLEMDLNLFSAEALLRTPLGERNLGCRSPNVQMVKRHPFSIFLFSMPLIGVFIPAISLYYPQLLRYGLRIFKNSF